MNPNARFVVLASLLVGSFAVTANVHAATISVNSFSDDPITATDDADCTLREAIEAANTDAAVDACAAGTGADIVSLPAGTYTLSAAPAGDETNAAGDLDVIDADPLTIQPASPTASVVVDGANLDRVLDVQSGATATLSNLTIRGGNAAADGGAIRNGGSLTMAGATITANKATGSGGGIANSNAATGSLSLTNSTISGNQANGSGGGLEQGGLSVTLNDATLVDNTADADANDTGDGGGIHIGAGTATAANTIIANNGDSSTPANLRQDDCSGTLTSQGYNLIEDVTGCTIGGVGTGNITGSDPRLLGLASNGGPTSTHLPRPTSPVINAANPAAPGSGGSACAATDQRGVSRPQGPRCDIGAVEVSQPAQPPQCLGREVTIDGTPAGEAIVGTNQADVVRAKAGDDVVTTLRRNDIVCAGPGNDRVKGKADDDTLAGQGDNDRLIGGGGNDLLRGQIGRDRLRGRSGDDRLRGGANADVLIGGAGFDICNGGPGRDRFRGCERRL